MYDVARGEARADARAAGGRIGARHEGIRAEVDVEHRALGALAEDGLPRRLRGVEVGHRVDDVGGELLLRDRVDARELVRVELVVRHRAARHLQRVARIHALGAEHLQLAVRLLHLLAHDVGEVVAQHVAAAEPRAAHLRGVGGTDPAARRADLLPGRTGGLLGLVERAVVEHHHLRAGGDEETSLRLHARIAHGLDLLDEVERVHHHAVADDARLALVQDAAREHALLALRDHGVAGVRAALVAHHHVRLVRQDVDDFSFAFISPLGANKNGIHYLLLLRRRIVYHN